MECGWGATRKKDCYLKRKYESLVGRRGKKKALVAVGHKIIIAVFHVLTNKEVYCEPVLHDNPRKVKKQVKYHLKKLKDLGMVIEQSRNIEINNNTGGRFFTEAQKEFDYEIDPTRANRVFV